MHRPATTERLVIASHVESELADEGAVGCHDTNVGAGDQQMHLAVAVGDADGIWRSRPR